MHLLTFETSQTWRGATYPRKSEMLVCLLLLALVLVLRKFGKTKQVPSVARSIIASENLKQSKAKQFHRFRALKPALIFVLLFFVAFLSIVFGINPFGWGLPLPRPPIFRPLHTHSNDTHQREGLLFGHLNSRRRQDQDQDQEGKILIGHLKQESG